MGGVIKIIYYFCDEIHNNLFLNIPRTWYFYYFLFIYIKLLMFLNWVLLENEKNTNASINVFI